MAKKVRIKELSDFVRESRQLEIGDELDVHHVSKFTDKDDKHKAYYLVDGKNGKPISLYENEVDIIEN